jgi:hypothetical protein
MDNDNELGACGTPCNLSSRLLLGQVTSGQPLSRPMRFRTRAVDCCLRWHYSMHDSVVCRRTVRNATVPRPSEAHHSSKSVHDHPHSRSWRSRRYVRGVFDFIARHILFIYMFMGRPRAPPAGGGPTIHKSYIIQYCSAMLIVNWFFAVLQGAQVESGACKLDCNSTVRGWGCAGLQSGRLRWLGDN